MTGSFNIINSDDIITDMPLEDKWGFIHYSNDIPNGVGDSHFEEWKSFTTLSYDFNQKKRMIFWSLSKHWLQAGMIAINFIAIAMEMVKTAKKLLQVVLLPLNMEGTIVLLILSRLGRARIA